MAYSNWGAFVYRDGERRKDKEDVGVFDTDEAAVPTYLRIWFNILKRRLEQHKQWDDMSPEEREADQVRHSHHAVLGDGRVRLCGYKNGPSLWMIGDDGTPHRVVLPDKPDDPAGCDDDFEVSGDLLVEGATWHWLFHQFDGTMIDLRLKEPTGTVWTSRCGYEYGAGWMDDDAGKDWSHERD